MISMDDEFTPVHEVDTGVNGDDVYTFARKYKAEIQAIYDILNTLSTRISGVKDGLDLITKDEVQEMIDTAIEAFKADYDEELQEKLDKIEDEISGVGSNIVKVTEESTNGTEWYRIYSDGWVEQGGHMVGNDGDTYITFQIEMADTNYCVQATRATTASYGKENVSSSVAVTVYDKLATGFTYRGRGQGGSGFTDPATIDWCVYGYKK